MSYYAEGPQLSLYHVCSEESDCSWSEGPVLTFLPIFCPWSSNFITARSLSGDERRFTWFLSARLTFSSSHFLYRVSSRPLPTKVPQCCKNSSRVSCAHQRTSVSSAYDGVFGPSCIGHLYCPANTQVFVCSQCLNVKTMNVAWCDLGCFPAKVSYRLPFLLGSYV